ncbi:MAG: enoyl-CoA hydratase/isomerase family protein [Gammaproteobacteria bacterium]|jgi:enoyl-CoA hydratase|nr:enoyl-CoA hydratase/isomerase family protein [Gammaproteobacteria bacterium]MDP6616376.1 enoyl-CoA hydratase/isomerase family protein [Gammaproteobacteria bacterium]MDP6695706.1 enoyl-CoA hydratase/isomerase family protein [Gammaproteobacteria bacterium]MDP7042164.1 enoyl-CoA hydratase/isomerase family protein [Gammaproteobacteria bacterium]
MNTDNGLLVDVDGDVLRLTLNRPEKRNALSLSLLDELGSALHENRDTPVKCAVITGAGDRCFAAGGDLQELDAIRTEDQTRAMSERGHAALDELRYFPVPVIGALNGLALGGGAELAMACDIRIATEQADLGLIHAQLNVTTAWGGGIDLINAIGNSAALAILCAGQRLNASEALQLRLYEAVCPEGEDFEAFTTDFLGRILSKSLNVLRGYKATSAARRRKLQDQLMLTAREAFIKAWTHEDHWQAAEQALKK